MSTYSPPALPLGTHEAQVDRSQGRDSVVVAGGVLCRALPGTLESSLEAFSAAWPGALPHTLESSLEAFSAGWPGAGGPYAVL